MQVLSGLEELRTDKTMWIIRMFINHFVYGFIRKAMRIILPLVILLLLFSGKSYADNSLTTNASYSFGANWTNATNATGSADNNFAIMPASNAYLMYSEIPTNTLPTGATITSIVVNYITDTSGNSGSQSISIQKNYQGTPITCTADNSFATWPVINWTNNNSSITFNSTNCPNWSNIATPANVNSGVFGSVVSSYYLHSGGARIDTVSITINYLSSSLNFSNFVISTASGNFTFDATGDTGILNADNQCKIDIQQNSTTGGYYNPSIGATVLIDSAEPRTTTLYEGNRIWDGYGYTSTSSIWHANTITMPYFAGTSTSLGIDWTCTHQDCTYPNGIKTCTAPIVLGHGQGINNLQPDFVPTLISTPSALQNTINYNQTCGDGDIICVFKTWLTDTLTYIFVPNTQYITSSFSTLYNTMLSKAPFAYFMDVFSLSFVPNTPNDTLAIVLPVKAVGYGIGNGIPDNISVTLPTVITNGIGLFRNFFIIMIWGMFIVYIIVRARSIFP